MAKVGGGAGRKGGVSGEGGPGSKVTVGGRTTTLRQFTGPGGGIKKAQKALSDYERGHKLSVKSRGRVQEARWKLNGVRPKLETPGQGKAARNAAKVVARVEKSGAAGHLGCEFLIGRNTVEFNDRVRFATG